MGIYSSNERKRNTLILAVMVLGIAMLLSVPRIVRSIGGTGGPRCFRFRAMRMWSSTDTRADSTIW